MPTAVIVVFFLFFAVLAFGWFYLQRAKARDTVTTVDAVAPATTVDATPASPVDTTDRPVS
jgi:hypothetical protein